MFAAGEDLRELREEAAAEFERERGGGGAKVGPGRLDRSHAEGEPGRTHPLQAGVLSERVLSEIQPSPPIPVYRCV